MMNKGGARGGVREGAGRPKNTSKAEKKVNLTIRLTLDQKAKLVQLGGAAWVREALIAQVLPQLTKGSKK